MVKKVLLTEEEMPRQWYNILADIKMNPPLGPDGKPVTPPQLRHRRSRIGDVPVFFSRADDLIPLPGNQDHLFDLYMTDLRGFELHLDG